MTTPVAIAAMLEAIVLAFLNGPIMALLLLALSAAITMLAHLYFHKRISGVTGDCLGATCLLTETALLILLSCRSSIS
jgi:cobalamin synthase